MGVSMAIDSITSWFTPTVLFCAANLIIATIFIASKTNHHQPADSSLSRVSSFLHRATSFNSSSSYSATITTETTRKYTSLSPLAQSIHSSSNDLSSSHGEELPAPSEPPLEIQPLSLFQRVNSSLKSSSDSPDQLRLDRPPSFVDRVKSFRVFDWGAAPPTQPDTVETRDPSHHPPEHHVIRSKSANNDPSTKNKNNNNKKKKSLVVEMKKSRSEMRMAPSDDEDDDEVDLRRPKTARDHTAGEEEEEEVDARADEFINRFKQQLKLQRLESLVRYKEMLNRRMH